MIWTLPDFPTPIRMLRSAALRAQFNEVLVTLAGLLKSSYFLEHERGLGCPVTIDQMLFNSRAQWLPTAHFRYTAPHGYLLLSWSLTSAVLPLAFHFQKGRRNKIMITVAPTTLKGFLFILQINPRCWIHYLVGPTSEIQQEILYRLCITLSYWRQPIFNKQ